MTACDLAFHVHQKPWHIEDNPQSVTQRARRTLLTEQGSSRLAGWYTTVTQLHAENKGHLKPPQGVYLLPVFVMSESSVFFCCFDGAEHCISYSINGPRVHTDGTRQARRTTNKLCTQVETHISTAKVDRHPRALSGVMRLMFWKLLMLKQCLQPLEAICLKTSKLSQHR